MWPFSSRRSRYPKPAPRLPRSARPRVRALEDRCLLSAGALDPTFGNGAGYVTTSFSVRGDYAQFVLVQPDGKVLTVGESSGSTTSAELVRYNADGSLDTSFGTGGQVLQSYTGGTPHAALYPVEGTANDGKIVLAGFSKGNFSVARFSSSGTLDTAFGANGIATANFGSTLGTWGAATVVVQADDKIDVIGTSSDEKTLELARFNGDGSLDTTFGQGGLVTTSLGGDVTGTPNLTNLLLETNGGLIASLSASGHWDLVAYNADGSLNSSFGNGGIVKSPQVGTQSNSLYGSALYPTVGSVNDGKIVLVGSGYSPSTPYSEMVRRYNPDGSLDSTFGTNGTLLANDEIASAAVIQPDGKIIVAGKSLGTSVAQVLARYNANGSLDNTFGSGGTVATAIGASPSSNQANGVALQPNGDIVAAGKALDPSGTKNDISVTRYVGDSPSLLVSGFPSSATAGTAGNITVTARNADGSTNTGYTGTVHFTSSDPHAVLPADYTFTAADQGVHTFSATLETAGGQTLTAVDTANATIIGGQAGIVVNPAAASQFVVSAPSSVTHGKAFTLTLTVEDAYGNVVTGYTGTVHFTSSDGTATLPSNYTFTAADAGVHTFTNKTTLRKLGTQTVTVTDTLNNGLSATDSIKVL